MIASDDKFSLFPSGNNFAQPQIRNQRSNIIAGPNTKPWTPGLLYWSHSPGDLEPIEREEGPFPIQGNIGQLVKEESYGYTKCGTGITSQFDISGTRNCTTSFYGDQYTTEDTCGSNCILSAPESFGDKDFGFTDNGSGKYTNAHGLHTYENIRAGGVGRSSQSGCYNTIPNVSVGGNGTCILDPKPEYQQVPSWTKLKENQNILKSSFSTQFKQ